ncbi:MAG: hypothetical protein ACO1O6_11050 [Bacteroidota bacterium]
MDQIAEYWGVKSVHIGKIIKEEVKKCGMTFTEFAGQINYSRRNVYKIFERETIDTGTLINISRIVGSNLFIHYLSESDLQQISAERNSSEDLKIVIDSLKIEVDRLREAKK